MASAPATTRLTDGGSEPVSRSILRGLATVVWSPIVVAVVVCVVAIPIAKTHTPYAVRRAGDCGP